eukprot:g65798.t1
MAQAEEIRTETGPLDYDYTEKEVELCQENLQNHKACSPDKIKNEMLKFYLTDENDQAINLNWFVKDDKLYSIHYISFPCIKRFVMSHNRGNDTNARFLYARLNIQVRVPYLFKRNHQALMMGTQRMRERVQEKRAKIEHALLKAEADLRDAAEVCVISVKNVHATVSNQERSRAVATILQYDETLQTED